MDLQVRLVASVLEKGFIHHTPDIHTDFCHVCTPWNSNNKKIECYQGKVYGTHWSWLVCDKCMSKIKNVPKEKMYLDEELLKQKLEEAAFIEKSLTTDYI
jgi:hypothetical protein